MKIPFFSGLLAFALVANSVPVSLAVEAPFQPPARLYAFDDGAAVRLLWSPFAWSESQIGFVVKRRVVEVAGASAAPWEPVTAETIRPEWNANANWAERGFNDAQIKELKEWSESHADLTKKTLTVDQVRQLLIKNQSMALGDSIRITNDGSYGFVFGLGCIDNARKSGLSYEYGLFIVSDGSIVGTEPVATIQPWTPQQREQWKTRSQVEVVHKVFRSKIELIAQMPVNIARQIPIAYFKVEGREDTDSQWTMLNKKVYYAPRKEMAQWISHDELPQDRPNKPRAYRLTPVSMFGVALSPVEYRVESTESERSFQSHAPKSVQVEKLPDGRVKLTWVLEKASFECYKLIGFRLQDMANFYAGNPSVDLYKAPLLPPDARELVLTKADLSEPRQVVLDAIYRDVYGYDARVSSEERLSLPAADPATPTP